MKLFDAQWGVLANAYYLVCLFTFLGTCMSLTSKIESGKRRKKMFVLMSVMFAFLGLVIYINGKDTLTVLNEIQRHGHLKVSLDSLIRTWAVAGAWLTASILVYNFALGRIKPTQEVQS